MFFIFLNINEHYVCQCNDNIYNIKYIVLSINKHQDEYKDSIYQVVAIILISNPISFKAQISCNPFLWLGKKAWIKRSTPLSKTG